jgi:hypothetical protein
VIPRLVQNARENERARPLSWRWANSGKSTEPAEVANDSLLVAHNIQPKEKAVKLCVECHSKNSILLASLYNYNRSKVMASSFGFENEIILNSSYVIGANRNEYLNIISLIILALVLSGILIHVTFRIITRK